jgi:hypothetical protein
VLREYRGIFMRLGESRLFFKLILMSCRLDLVTCMRLMMSKAQNQSSQVEEPSGYEMDFQSTEAVTPILPHYPALYFAGTPIRTFCWS